MPFGQRFIVLHKKSACLSAIFLLAVYIPEQINT